MALLARIKNWVTAETLTASDLNTEFDNILNNGLTPTAIEDISSNVANMRATLDPGESGTETLPTSLKEELQQVRKILAELSGKTYWYQSPATALETVNANNWVTTDRINAGAVTNAKMAADSVGTTQLVDVAVTTSKLANDAVTSTKIGAGAVDATALATSAVTESKIADGVVSLDKLNIVNAQVNSIASASSTTSSSFSTLYSATLASATSAERRPIFAILQPDSSTTAFRLTNTSGGVQDVACEFRITIGGSTYLYSYRFDNVSSTGYCEFPAFLQAVSYIHTTAVSASIDWRVVTASTTLSLTGGTGSATLVALKL